MDKKNQNLWQQRMYFAGFDWAKDHHDVVVVDRAGQIMMEMTLKHNASGWNRLREKLHALAGRDLSVVAVAVGEGAILMSGCIVICTAA